MVLAGPFKFFVINNAANSSRRAVFRKYEGLGCCWDDRRFRANGTTTDDKRMDESARLGDCQYFNFGQRLIERSG
jgi:hypothetical protein